jgi:hypothetical protein
MEVGRSRNAGFCPKSLNAHLPETYRETQCRVPHAWLSGRVAESRVGSHDREANADILG